MSLIFLVIFLIFGAAQYYLSLRLWPLFNVWLGCSVWLYGAVMLLTGLAYPLGRLTESIFPASVGMALTVFGSYWLGVIFYGFWIFLLLDFFFYVGHFLHLFSSAWQRQDPRLAALGCLAIVMVFSYGVWNARHPVVTSYDVNIAKSAGDLTSLNIVMVSDIHAGRIIANGQLADLMRRINELQPDLVLLPGDIIDENVDVFAEERMSEAFLALNPRWGVYATLGNHEYITRNPLAAVTHLGHGGVNVLVDRCLKIADSFYLVGRDDFSSARFTEKPRQPLVSLLAGTDQRLPVIVMDHQPFHLEEADQAGVDLQVSGHTHQGQMFPNNLITQRLYEIDWGYLRKNALHAIVSCGYGTWGPPLRVGNQPEIVLIRVRFSANGS